MENDVKQPVTYTHKDVAQMLNIGESSARKLMKSSDFPSFKLGAKTLVAAQDFDEWLRNLPGKEFKIGSKNEMR